MKIPEGLLYTSEHEWIKKDGAKAYIGITDYAQHALGAIVFVELPDPDANLAIGDTLGVVESVKAASDVYSPLSGTVVEINDAIVDDPALLNSDPFENWMVCLEYSHEEELAALMTPAAYQALCEKE